MLESREIAFAEFKILKCSRGNPFPGPPIKHDYVLASVPTITSMYIINKSVPESSTLSIFFEFAPLIHPDIPLMYFFSMNSLLHI